MRPLGWAALALAALAAGCVDVPDYAFPDAEPRDADRRPPPDRPDGRPPPDAAPPADMAPPTPDEGCVRRAESCNGLDDDCDLAVDEDFDLLGDLDNCGGCGLACRPGNADPVCVEGECRVAACAAGFADIDDDPINGCEYPCPTDVGAEQCNGLDDDCDARVDEALDGRAVGEVGVCVDAVRVCMGAEGFGPPQYAALPDYEAEEARCDGLDNDCDGATDEAQPTLGDACTVGLGACARDGRVVCPAGGAGPGVCNAEPGMAAVDDRCDGVDADCDGRVDEGLAGCVQCAGPGVGDGDAAPCNGCPAGVAVPAGWVCLPAGEFTMGSPAGEAGRLDREGPTHRVRLTLPVLMQATEVTQRAWGQVFEDDPSFFRDQPRRPVERVNWFEAAHFANALSAAEGRPLCYGFDGCSGAAPGAGLVCATVRFEGPACAGYRLPTEAEWAYGARAGTSGRYWFGEDPAGLSMTDFVAVNSGQRTHEVGQLAPNPWGLYDVHGNVWEWVHDGFAAYVDALEIDPIGAEEAEDRVRRGGSFAALAEEARAAYRAPESPTTRSARGGFRLVRTLP